MDPEQTIRMQCLSMARQSLGPTATLQKVMQEAEKLVQWIGEPKTPPQPAPFPSAPEQHESVAAVKGQEPRA